MPDGPVAGRPVAGRPGEGRPAGDGPEEDRPDVRVNARHLESAILSLRQPIVAAPLLLEAPGAAGMRAERRKLLAQIDDYLLPRLRESGAPMLVALVGSTGAGKSTLVNSIVGTQVSNTGIRRPTTNSPVLACHPDDVAWFAENVFLPTVPRVRQEGLARSGRDGLLVLAANEGMPKGVALLDTPDIDSEVQAHREFAHQFLDASDLWLFMTTAGRYADAAVWDLLQQARDRGAALGIVLSRVPEGAAPQLVRHFDAMLAANRLGRNQRFVIPETVLMNGKLPGGISGPVRDWLASMAVEADRRIAVLSQTMSGVLDTFRTRIPALAAHVESQLALRAGLQAAAEGGYTTALAELEHSLRDGSLLRGEVLARWQDFAGTGDLVRALQSRRGGRGASSRQRRQQGQARAQKLKQALRDCLESLVASVADRAAEDAVARWRDHPAGAALLDQLSGSASRDGWRGSRFAADAGARLGPGDDPFLMAEGSGGADEIGSDQRTTGAELGRASADLPRRAARAVSGWQDSLARVVRAENVTKRSIARVVALDEEALAAVLVVALLGQDDDSDEDGAAAMAHRLLTSLLGTALVRDVLGRAQSGLRERICLLLDEEMLRFTQALDAAGVPEATAALRLYQATYMLEVAR
ncbi:MAG: 50S ribosome-binding GTPase [Nocardiopsaceae bacterium]|nr:50S ribosome-binding GTPase [Nocardiopsaceae bacterium]